MNFQDTWLWQHAFQTDREDCSRDEQQYFALKYCDAREKAGALVSRIATDIPGLTVHDLTHLDALWETASLVAADAINVSAAEAYVFGVSVLLHDAGMSLAAYPDGLGAVMQTTVWRDTIARMLLESVDRGDGEFDTDNPPEEVVRKAIPTVLRLLHAAHAEELVNAVWQSGNNEYRLVEDEELRNFYGQTIGRIAHSHWWPVHRIEHELEEHLGALGGRTTSVIDRIKVACLLRVADALHLDSRRAPRFLRAITEPTGESADHWAFQERLSSPYLEGDRVVFTAGLPFKRTEAEAWWLAYETINAVDRELQDVEMLLRGSGRECLGARGAKGAGSPATLSRTLETEGWQPVDARFKVTDVTRVMESFGGTTLYGADASVPLRELIQNGLDAVQARRRLEERPRGWGEVIVSIDHRDDGDWLAVEDNGVGMSENVLAGPLLDFGNSLWRSSLATEEFPGLLGAGLRPVGKFGVGFFSVFMSAEHVHVYSRRYDRGHETGRLLEFRGGIGTRPIISPSTQVPIDGGTKVEVRLREGELKKLLNSLTVTRVPLTLKEVVGALAPTADTAVRVREGGVTETVVEPEDWLIVDGRQLIARVNPPAEWSLHPAGSDPVERLVQILSDSSGRVFGRACIWPTGYQEQGLVCTAGIRAGKVGGLKGVLLGESVRVSRDLARPVVPNEVLARWATDQAARILKEIKDPRQQALSAQVVLACGGSIGALKLVRLGEDWISEGELREELRRKKEFALALGEFDYEQDLDDVLLREFEDKFEQAEDVATIPRGWSVGIRVAGLVWPAQPQAKRRFRRRGWPSTLGGSFQQSGVRKLSQRRRNAMLARWITPPLSEPCEFSAGTDRQWALWP